MEDSGENQDEEDKRPRFINIKDVKVSNFEKDEIRRFSYVVQISWINPSNQNKEKTVVRRYDDFEKFEKNVREKFFPKLNIKLPDKESFLRSLQKKEMLEKYLQELSGIRTLDDHLASFLEITLFELREAVTFWKNSQNGSTKSTLKEDTVPSLPRKQTRFRGGNEDGSTSKSKVLPAPPAKSPATTKNPPTQKNPAITKAPAKAVPAPPSQPTTSFADRLAQTFSIFGKDEEKTEKEKPKVTISFADDHSVNGSAKNVHSAKQVSTRTEEKPHAMRQRRTSSLDGLTGLAKDNRKLFEQTEESAAPAKQNKTSKPKPMTVSSRQSETFLGRGQDDEVVITGPSRPKNNVSSRSTMEDDWRSKNNQRAVKQETKTNVSESKNSGAKYVSRSMEAPAIPPPAPAVKPSPARNTVKVNSSHRSEVIPSAPPAPAPRTTSAPKAGRVSSSSSNSNRIGPSSAPATASHAPATASHASTATSHAPVASSHAPAASTHAHVPAKSNGASSRVVFCRNCGAEKTIAQAKFCTRCGEPL
eukprot:TRINITY_DN30264_c0_g3_i1.p1 TRINITY_DN30264_c0_g3~~TRINITY_DN30264_c0_g3_i1.p1  ORF type:complete len:603 (-),score=152.99 TRINITY_DN30264_c0_g3_i1:44-1639(-)